MTMEDIFYTSVVVCFVVGILSLFLSYATTTGISALSAGINATGLPNLPGVVSLSSGLYNFAFFFPDLAAIMVIVLIIQTWILSWFIKAHPLAAVSGIFALFGYTIVSFFVSNAVVGVARLPLFSPVIAFANPLLFLFINMPVVLFLAGIVDIAVALTAARM